jgi:hypothetical protein
MSLILSLAVLVGGSFGTTFHTPHSEASSVAFAKLANGQTEILLISRKDSKVLKSLDQGFTWNPVAGQGLDKVEAHRVVYYEVPATGEKRFIIGTDNGIWQYMPETDVVENISTGLDVSDLYITDLAAADAGQDAPVVALSKTGRIYFFDETADSWTLSTDLGKVDLNGIVKIAPQYDRNAANGTNKTILVGTRGLLVETNDGGGVWTAHSQFALVANDIFEFHINALEFDTDYQNTGLIIMGRGRVEPLNLTESEGEIWRSTDFGVSYTRLSPFGSPQINSGVYAMASAGLGPDGNNHYYAAVYRFPSHDDFDLGEPNYGLLHSIDGGLTWDDQGSFQEFIQEFSANERTAVGLSYRRMMDIAISPDFATNGELWIARAEGLYFSPDQGITWGKRRFRPSTQVRGISSGYDYTGDVVTFGSTYGSGIYRYNATDQVSSTLLGTKIIYYAEMVTSPSFTQDGISMAGGQRDLGIEFEAPQPTAKQGWFFVDELIQATGIQVGYVRTIALDPDFGGSNVPGANQIFAWSSRFEDSPLGETGFTMDALTTVYPLNDVYNQPLQRAPHMHSMDIAPGFDEVNLPRELGIYGSSQASDQLYKLLNTGTTVAPVFEWDIIPFDPGSTPIVVKADPNYSVTSNRRLWVLASDGMFRLDDLSTDWSNFTITSYPGLMDYLPTDMALVPNMNQHPAIYISTWGGGVFKMDLTASSPAWSPVGTNFPPSWSNVLSLSPDFANDHTVFVGTQHGLYYCQDLPGATWATDTAEIYLDAANTSFEYYSPNDPTNPDTERPWGWDLLKYELIPLSARRLITIEGESILTAKFENDYCDFTVKAGSMVSVLSVLGPMMGVARITAWDYQTGSPFTPFHDVTVDLNAPGLANTEFDVPLPAPGVYTIRVEASSLPLSKYMFIDGVRIRD